MTVGACRSATGRRRGGLGVLQLPTIKASRSILPLLARIGQNSSAMVVLRPWRACSVRVQGSAMLSPLGLGEVVGVVVDACVSVPCSEAAIGVDVGPPRWRNHVGGHGALGDGEQRAVRGLTFGVDGERMAVQWRVMAVSRRCRAVLSSRVDVVDRGDVLRCGDTGDVGRLRRSFFFLYPLSLLARVCRGWPPGGDGARDRARATGARAFIAEARPWHGVSG